MHAIHSLDELAVAYGLHEEPLLRAIADRSPTVVDTLLGAQRRILEDFGPGVRFRLSITPDPEFFSHQPIIVEINPPPGMEDASERLEKFDLEWWVEASQREAAEICFLLLPQ